MSTPPRPHDAIVASHATAVLILKQVEALATQIVLRPDLAEERALMILDALEQRKPAGERIERVIDLRGRGVRGPSYGHGETNRRKARERNGV